MDSQAPSGDFVDCDFDLPDDVDGALLMELLDDVVGDDDNQGGAAEIPGPDDDVDVDDGAGWVSSGEADHISIDEWSGPAAACRIDGLFDWEAMEMDGGWYVESLCMGEGFDDYVHGDYGFCFGEPYVVEQDCSPLWE
ncbi:hypothetical protein QJS10_CPA03g00627 [Acorus calamus]|uniref:Uncharacterized protein n=1 Tax=Acorus calamus TaxID=4465 RepID=A0AAV9F381_ACOCL|nr:hypothetical protein QJS10_CPA03g00627 [Acorus calamus]